MTGNLGRECGRKDEFIRDPDMERWTRKEGIPGQSVEPEPIVSAVVFQFAANFWRDSIGQRSRQPERGRACPIRLPEFPFGLRSVDRIKRREQTIWNELGVGEIMVSASKIVTSFPPLSIRDHSGSTAI
jgi:hypothetical protein